MAIRKKLIDFTLILEEMGQRASAASPETRAVVAQFAENVGAQIVLMPQLSLVRPATIALRNLSTSLRNDEPFETMSSEIGTALEAVRELLDEPSFGYAPRELADSATRILSERGAMGCTVCRTPDRELTIMSADVRPFPAEKSLAAQPMPVAMLTCPTCGLVSWHSLRALGIM